MGDQGQELELTETECDHCEKDNDDLVHFWLHRVTELHEKVGNENHAPIAGNMYSYLALLRFGEESKPPLYQSKSSYLLLVGLVTVMVVQFIGPFCILFWASSHIEIGEGTCLRHRSSDAGMYTHMKYYTDIPFITRLIGALFIILFCLNGMYAMKSGTSDAQKTLAMCRLFHVVARESDFPYPKEYWLWVGAIVKVSCVTMCSVCLVLLFNLDGESPKDVIFDGLALNFLYNLDDIADSDVGFLTNKWNAVQFGRIYGLLADKTSSVDETKTLVVRIQDYKNSRFTVDAVCHVGYLLMWFLTFLLPTIYVFANIRPKPEEGDGDDIQASILILRAQVANLTAIVLAENRSHVV